MLGHLGSAKAAPALSGIFCGISARKPSGSVRSGPSHLDDSENDDEDLAEMRDGVVKGLRLTEDEKEVVRRNVFYDTEQTRTGPAFLAYVERRLQSCSGLDLLRLDPFMGCLGADLTDTEKRMAFLRNGLNPLLTRYQVACILNYHTPKTTNRQTDSWRGSDWMYAVAGGADITNWARAVMVIDPTHVPHVFKFIAAKRGPRVGWVDEDFKKQIIRHFCHAEDGIYWRAATEEDLMAAQEAAAAKSGPANKKVVLTVEKLLKFIPEGATIEQRQLKARS
ncbi:MAG: hypothetical protein JWL59_236 [Chthoniobacteraceae bacterium]|nr:hypothetical protein [Chthoniobacteraceae bacterium]